MAPAMTLIAGFLLQALATQDLGERRAAIRLSDSVALVLAEVAERNETEIIGCLTVDDENVVVAVRFPPLAYSRSNGAALAEPCDPSTERGFWHNHPPSARLPRGQVRKSLCYLSRLDAIQSADFDFAVVHVDRETWCWWTREQVLASALYVIQPAPGQFSVSTFAPRIDREVLLARPTCKAWTHVVLTRWNSEKRELEPWGGPSMRVSGCADPEGPLPQ